MTVNNPLKKLIRVPELFMVKLSKRRKTFMITMRCSLIFIVLLHANAFAQNIIEVDVFIPESAQNANQTIFLTGTVEAEQHANLAVLEAGVVKQLFVEVGDNVTAGQKLMTLDATLANLTLSEATAALSAAQVARDEAQRLYEEVLALSKKQVVAQTLIAERNAALAAAEAALIQQGANVELRKEVLNRHTLYAPFAGVIAQRHADLGEWVTQQTPVYTLIEQNNLRLSVAIPQEYYGLLSGKAVSAKVQPDFQNADTVYAQLDRLVAVTDNQSRTLTGHIYLPDDTTLLAGMSASAQIVLPNQSADIVWLPRTALKVHPDGGSSVFVVKDNTARRVLVEVVDQNTDQIAVKNTSADQVFVASGVELLKDGDSLQVNKPQEAL